MTAGELALRDGLRGAWELLRPPPKLTVSQWADAHRVVSSYSAEPGPWRTDRTPYLREIMDGFSDPTVQMVAFMKCARIGGTEAGLNIVGYFIDQDPSHILVVQPTVDDAKDFSKEQLAPMIADTAVLAGAVKNPKSRDSGNTVQAKQFPGGGLYLVGANSPRGFRRRTVRVLDLEEIDGYPDSAGTEGDQIKLALRRTATYGYRRKVYLNSTPTLKGFSRIEDYFLRGDQRRYYVPCPACGVTQGLVWRQLRYDHDGPPRYACAACQTLIGEESKYPMLLAGAWVPDNPSATYRSYHINALYSPWVTWSELVEEWKEAQQDRGKLQVFVNTALGETWEESGGFDAGSMRQRLEHWPALPAWIRVLTMGVDVQDGFLEYAVYGWGPGEEWALVETAQLPGDPGRPDVWRTLDAVRARTWPQAQGALTVSAVAVDSGYHTDAVYAYVKPRQGQGVVAVKGSSTPGRGFLPKKFSTNNKARVRLYELGTESGKDLIYSRLRQTVPGPGFLHLPTTVPDTWFEQIGAEKPERKLVSGRWTRRYVLPEGKRSEALDCAVYALAVARQFFPWLQRAPVVAVPDTPEPPGPASVEVPPALQPPAPSRPRGIRVIGRLNVGKPW